MAMASHPYWPDGASGVTLGAGYDMGKRTVQGVHDDLRKADVPEDLASQLAEGAGLTRIPRLKDGMTAEKWKNAHCNLQLNHDQLTKLYRLTLVKYEGYVRNSVTVDLLPNEFDALVSFGYNTPAGLQMVAAKLNRGDVLGALQSMETYLVRGDQAKDDRVRLTLAHRRRNEVYGHR
jgi:GH24 family phage-related lysozyme (muramidase)